MKLKAFIFALVAFTLQWGAFSLALADGIDPLKEYRYCTVTPHRDADGTISRRADVLRAFKTIHACPSTGKLSGACPGWSMDHVVPLANGGCDSVVNLQWLPHQIKSCAGKFCKDRWERVVYNRSPPLLSIITAP